MMGKDFGMMEDALREMEEEIRRLMELHLEVMTYFTRAIEAERLRSEASVKNKDRDLATVGG